MWFHWNSWIYFKTFSAGHYSFRIFLTRHLKPASISFRFTQNVIADVSENLVVIGLFLKHWNTQNCSRIFDSFTRDFFDVHLTKDRDFFTRMRDYFRCWLIDDCYDVELLKSTLKNVFESQHRMFDTHEFGIFDCKVAGTAITISDASVFVFSNYNDDDTRKKNCDNSSSIKALCVR